jgi:hypothetical protein
MVPLYYDAITPPYPVGPCTEVSPAGPHPSVSISSLEAVDKIIESWHGVFYLEDPRVAADEYSTGVGVFLATWKWKMCLSAGFNLAVHREGEVRRFWRGLGRLWGWVLG